MKRLIALLFVLPLLIGVIVSMPLAHGSGSIGYNGIKQTTLPKETMATVYSNFRNTWGTTLASKSKPVVAVVGDSISKKYNASSIAKSWAGLMQKDLQALKGNGGSGFRGVTDGYGANFGAAVLGDKYSPADRVIFNGSWQESSSATFPYSGPGFSMASSVTPGSSATFTVTGSHLKLYYLGVTGTGGVLGFTIDGVTIPGTINVGSKPSNAPLSTTISSIADNETHTVTVTLLSGGVNLYGVSGENPTGAVVNVFARPGASAKEVNGGTNAGADWNGGIYYRADLIIYALGVNDLGEVDAYGTQVADHAKNFMSRLRESGVTAPVIMLSNHPGKFDVNNRHVAIQARMREIAESYGGAYVDMWSKYDNSWAAADAAGYWGSTTTLGAPGDDPVHPSDIGHASIWNSLREVVII